MFKEKNTCPQCPDPFKDKVKCTTCKCWVDKSDASKVDYWGVFGRSDYYYCQTHKKPYDENTNFGHKARYFARVEVDEKGEPEGYTKNKK